MASTFALMTTWALPAPSVWASIALTCEVIVESYFCSADCLESIPSPAAPEPEVGHSCVPSEPFTVTLLTLSPGTLEATSCAMPRTDSADSWLPPSSTDAVDGWVWSEKS